MAKKKTGEDKSNALSWEQHAANVKAGGDLSEGGPLAPGMTSGKTPSGQGNKS